MKKPRPQVPVSGVKMYAYIVSLDDGSNAGKCWACSSREILTQNHYPGDGDGPVVRGTFTPDKPKKKVSRK